MDHNIIKNALNPGTIVAGQQAKYVIEAVIGAGGFGITYMVCAEILYNNIPLKARFALKEHFISDLFEREESTTNVSFISSVTDKVQASIKDFISEANRLVKVGIDHPNIVKVNEVFSANNTAYYVMEYLEGRSLAELIKDQGKLSEERTISIMTPILKAVGALHRSSLTHLDIKPQNIMLTNSQGKLRPVLIDFGLAKHYGKDGSPTSTLNTLGCSHGYSPVEQYVGITTFSPTADIYALGATLYHCITGKIPPRAIDIIESELAAELEKVASPHMRNAILHAMNASAKERPQSVDTLLSEMGIASDLDKTEFVTLNSDHEKTEFVSNASVDVADNNHSIPYSSYRTSKVNQSPVNSSDDAIKFPKKSSRKPIIIGSIVLGAIVGLTLFFFMIGKFDGSSLPGNDETERIAMEKEDSGALRKDSVVQARADSIRNARQIELENQKKAQEEKKKEEEKQSAELVKFETSINSAYNDALSALYAMNNGSRFRYVRDCDCYDYEYDDDEYLANVIAKANKVMNTRGWNKYRNASPAIKKKCDLIQSVKSKASYIRSKAAGWA